MGTKRQLYNYTFSSKRMRLWTFGKWTYEVLMRSQSGDRILIKVSRTGKSFDLVKNKPRCASGGQCAMDRGASVVHIVNGGANSRCNKLFGTCHRQAHRLPSSAIRQVASLQRCLVTRRICVRISCDEKCLIKFGILNGNRWQAFLINKKLC